MPLAGHPGRSLCARACLGILVPMLFFSPSASSADSEYERADRRSLTLPVSAWHDGILLDDGPHDLGELDRGELVPFDFLIGNRANHPLTISASR